MSSPFLQFFVKSQLHSLICGNCDYYRNVDAIA
nr:MAG TPA: hypothetical protein [Caudoviricetes sp.]